MQFVPLNKRSKKAQREFYAQKRGSWYGVNPISQTIQNRKAYDRARAKQSTRRNPEAI